MHKIITVTQIFNFHKKVTFIDMIVVFLTQMKQNDFHTSWTETKLLNNANVNNFYS